MSNTALPSFTAAYAHKRAWRNAERIAGASFATATTECGHCNGTCNITLHVSTFGQSEIKKSHTPCCFCKDGRTNPIVNAYNTLVMCGCKNRGDTCGFIWARDGRRVFGNDTYLCKHCGFVRQFG